MVKGKKKVIGLALVGVLSFGGITSIASVLNELKMVKAADEDPEPDNPGYETFQILKAKLRHFENSLSKNYWGIKNQGTWEGYIKELRDLIDNLSKVMDNNYYYLDEKQINFYDDLLKFIAKINQVEKSYEVNYHGIKNAAQWREYLDIARNDSVLQEYYKKLNSDYGLTHWYLFHEKLEKFTDLLQRLDSIDAKVKVIEDAHYADLAKVEAKFNEAKASNSLSKAKEALVDANKLGTHESSTKIKNEIENFIKNINNSSNLAEPSLKVVETTSTRIVVDVVFPNSTADGNNLSFHDFTGQLKYVEPKDHIKNGRYTFENLTPDTMYTVRLTYKGDGKDIVLDIRTEKGTTEPSNVSEVEKEVARLVNIERQKVGLSPLTLDESISSVARLKSQDMIDNKYFNHNSPTYGSPFEMLTKFGIGFGYAGENIAKGQSTAQQVMTSWMNSDGHRANILGGNFKKIGVGYAGDVWTQLFTD